MNPIKVCYLLGAGASYGKRKDKTDRKDEGDFMIEGIPVVAEIPQRLNYIISYLESFNIVNDNDTYSDYSDLIRILVEDLKWLKIESSRHATIDTYAKKLYLKRDIEKYNKVEILLTIFIIIEQIINKPDSRYDTFFANILDSNREVPSNISILTWNYDSQLEICYREYEGSTTYAHLSNKLQRVNVSDPHKDEFIEKPMVINLNGSAYLTNKKIPLTDKSEKGKLTSFCYIFDCYNEFLKNPDGIHTKLNFAWEQTRFTNYEIWKDVESSINESEILIVIGYTFPFFNREVDRKIFNMMPKLRKIYYQDPNAKNLIENIKPVILNNNAIDEKSIIPITNIDQFYLPPEL